MNDYVFEIEYDDGYTEEAMFSAANLVMAHEMLLDYLEECCIDKRDVVVTHVEVTCYDEGYSNDKP